jgi:hypothetical protein
MANSLRVRWILAIASATALAFASGAQAVEHDGMRARANGGRDALAAADPRAQSVPDEFAHRRVNQRAMSLPAMADECSGTRGASRIPRAVLWDDVDPRMTSARVLPVERAGSNR